MIERFGEEPLYLPGVEVDRHDAVGARRQEQVGHQPGGDGLPGQHLLVGARITEERRHRAYAVGRGPLQGVDEDQLLHDVEVDLRRMALDHEAIGPAHRLQEPGVDLGVGELRQFHDAQPHAELLRDSGRQLRVGRSGEQLEALAVYEFHPQPASWRARRRSA